MSEEKIEEDVLFVLHRLVEEIEEEEDDDDRCDDCGRIDSSVKGRNTSEGSKLGMESNVHLYLCGECEEKRHQDSEKVLRDLESLAHEVEERLEAIENSERELDQWRDQQLEKNRHFWDEYRRQVENFSASRIRNLQYEYTMKQLKSERIVKRLKRVKYLSENFDQFREELFHFIEPSLIHFISNHSFLLRLNWFLSNNEENCCLTDEERKEFFQELEQLSPLDKIIFPNNHFSFDEQFKDHFQ